MHGKSNPGGSHTSLLQDFQLHFPDHINVLQGLVFGQSMAAGYILILVPKQVICDRTAVMCCLKNNVEALICQFLTVQENHYAQHAVALEVSNVFMQSHGDATGSMPRMLCEQC